MRGHQPCACVRELARGGLHRPHPIGSSQDTATDRCPPRHAAGVGSFHTGAPGLRRGGGGVRVHKCVSVRCLLS